jgi:hypothetical protein
VRTRALDSPSTPAFEKINLILKYLVTYSLGWGHIVMKNHWWFCRGIFRAKLAWLQLELIAAYFFYTDFTKRKKWRRRQYFDRQYNCNAILLIEWVAFNQLTFSYQRKIWSLQQFKQLWIFASYIASKMYSQIKRIVLSEILNGACTQSISIY